jgi:small redox-active disulfide protein 2
MHKIEILGTGCPKCEKLADNAREAVSQLEGEYVVEKVTSITDIVARGVLSTPALAVDGQVVVSGRLASADEIRQLLR